MATPPNIAPSVYVENSAGGSGGIGTDTTPNVSTIKDGSTTNKLAVDSSGRTNTVISDGTTPGNRLAIDSAGRISSVTPVLGIGDFFKIPTTATNAAPVTIGSKPTGARGIIFYFASGQSAAVNYSDTQANSQADFSNGLFFNYGSTVALIVNEYVGTLQNVYVGAVVGTPLARWL